ncbi:MULTISPECIES: pyridoxal-phosphate-dependent aminotransferase family protein [unclassified Rhizobium]|uniref:pyridoxal-phosphate-dependent aminotransferase family protein n=1 Tax=unclassified Rhizobium TaxID=2613769 RepID=UPI0017866825|nr:MULTISPECIES: aminotransferase class V-fold PLP-dependent enzyme [unclassified Rhizobium]MBD8687499.1 alanine--glyoxylate aminotransferase family protein [Rhizobium sp. CFBP 13644]MBD8691953.1 alanine--glyoxylate aminotransferase family protein [Rhizobium sp. CFBP 13717]
MPDRHWDHLLDIPSFPVDHYGSLAYRLAALMGTRNDVILVQAEAVVALEAVATSLARPDRHALNIVTSPYGTWFGNWLQRGGADVVNLCAKPAQPITVEAVRAALDANPDIAALAIVHAESASGILNPLEDIVALASARGILTIVDAVASIGGHALDVDRLGIDIAVIGPQKSLAGPAGVSAVSISQRAWTALAHDKAPRNSILSLMDQKEQWLESGRLALPGTPAPLEFFALEAALDRIETEGMHQVISRHQRASAATRSGLRALSVELWANDMAASALVTTAVLPADINRTDFLSRRTIAGSDLSSGVGPGTDLLVRLNHTGQRACEEAVLANLTAYAKALETGGHSTNLEYALLAAVDAYRL